MSEVLDLHEVYVKNETGLLKVAELRGTRRAQVALRREMRQKYNVQSPMVVLYTNGQLRKVGIDNQK